jgi:putative transposase
MRVLQMRGKGRRRTVHFSVMSNHLHMVVEADSSHSLTRGMQGLNIRLAKAINDALNRSGKIFADHYHSRLLRTPTEVVIAIRYVQNNAAHHYGETGEDFFSSVTAELRDLVELPLGWLLSIGWTRARLRGKATAD